MDKERKGFDNYCDAYDYAIDHGMEVHRSGRKYYVYPKDEVVTMHNKMRFSPRKYISIASQLCYPPDVINKLIDSKSETEAENIMAEARKNL